VDSAAVNVGVQGSLLCVDLHSFRHMPETGTEGSHGRSSLAS
jgi:hypothetical protein